jgi:low temperature requirement protein LtrA
MAAMTLGAQPTPWRRRMIGRDPDEHERASTPLELLFDLTFVVAVARAAAELHHALAEGHVAHALVGYGMVFFGIWWAWMNFTWFASAYDTDDVPYRLLTLVQMGGVLVFAAGIPAWFDHNNVTTVLIGYVIMRLALVAQWLRAAREHPEGRSGTLRYAAGVATVQACWIAWQWVPQRWGPISFAVLALAELAVPVWAEFARATSWHPGHITERYGLFTIIVLGEVVAAATTAVQSALAAGGRSPALLTTAAGGLLLVFALWWSYFKHSSAERVRRSLGSTIVWGYGHYVVFAAVAALGAGLQAVVDTLTPGSAIAPRFAAFTVAIPVAVFLIALGLLNVRSSPGQPVATPLVLVTALLVLLTALSARQVGLPLTVIIMALLVALLLAYHLSAANKMLRRHVPYSA